MSRSRDEAASGKHFLFGKAFRYPAEVAQKRELLI